MNSETPPRRVWRRLLAGLPGLLVLVFLAAVAVWGHGTGWSLTAPPSAVTPETPTTTLSESNGNVQLRFDSEAAIDAFGIEVLNVAPARIEETVNATAITRLDPHAVTRVSARVDGTVRDWKKIPGDSIDAGEIIGYLESAQVAEAKADYLKAFVTARQSQAKVKRLEAAGVTAAATLREAIAEQATATESVTAQVRKLTGLGFQVKQLGGDKMSLDEVAAEVRTLDAPEGHATSSWLPIRASSGGVVLAVDTVPGEMVTLGHTLATIVTPKAMTLTADVPMALASQVRPGLPIEFRPDGAFEVVTGKVERMLTAADPVTRTIAVQAELPNPEGVLKFGLPGTMRIIVQSKIGAIVVPQTAVVALDGHTVVFVRHPDYFRGVMAFRARTVETGIVQDGHIEITSGLNAQEIVAIRGAAALADEVHRRRSTGGSR